MARKIVRTPAGNPRGEPPLRVRDFLALVHEGVRGRLGAGLDGLEMRQRFSFVQYFRAGSAEMHYEVWAQRKTGRVEIGLHFEGERERNYEALEALALRAPDVQERIGTAYEFEEWTKSWTRLHRSSEAPSLTPALADDAADRLCALIRGMEPIIDQMDLRRLAAALRPARAPARAHGAARRR
ncbi:MAG: hypothetical protein IVW36_05870 [Dehalococcoidia bacterium]|nr:hypothetical protein [Dehalococcoidia bacterium]